MGSFHDDENASDNPELSRGRQRRARSWPPIDTRAWRDRVTNAAKRHHLIVLGAAASLCYGLWGFLERFTVEQHPAIVNVVVYGVAFLISLNGIRRFRRPSAAALVAGAAGGAINGLILVLLQRHAVSLVYPFVSCGSLFFIAFTYLFLGGELVVRDVKVFWSGVATAIIGLILCGLGLAGGVASLTASSSDPVAIYLACFIALLTGLWLFLAFFAISRQQYHPRIAATWVFFASFAVACAVALISHTESRIQYASTWMIAAVAAGVFIFTGELATYYGFAAAPTPSHRAEQSLTALLANSELLPIIILSAIVLRDVTAIGAVGALLVIAGIWAANHARA